MEILTHVHERSKGHNGVYPVYILNKLNVKWEDLKDVLNELFLDKKIIIRDGSRGKLIFKKDN